MDKESHQLAVYAFGMLNEQLSPLYLQARQDFLSRLAMADVSLNTLQGKVENDTHNREVITAFCSTLPSAALNGNDWRGHDSYLVSSSIDEIAAQQASTLFVNTEIVTI